MQNIFQLINQFTPKNYKISLSFQREKRTFSGRVTITGSSISTSDTIILHSKELSIKSVILDNKSADFSLGDNDELIIIKNQKGRTQHSINVSFEGKINDSMHGVYPCYFEHNGVKKELLATQFESHHAREVFPCVDEPAAKASFDLALTTEANVSVLGNMPIKGQKKIGDNLQTVFNTTPTMSTYLLAWVIGDLHKKTAYTKSGVEVNVWATIAQNPNEFDFALDIATRSIDYFDEYFGVPYPLPKCDHVALPDFSFGAMENWGLITYREVLLLENPRTTSIANRHHIALVIAHELSHQWFGNLVTMKWWNDLWLNESFATLIEYMAIDALEPDWNIWLDFASGDCIYALRRDRLDGVQSVQTDVKHPDEIGTLFDGAIVYAKGARLLKMLRCYIGDDAFRRGLEEYFKEHAHKNTEAIDLWAALSKSSQKDVASFMTTWISQPGFPVLHASIHDNKLSLSQNRISNTQKSQKCLWPIPLMSNNKDVPELFNKTSTIINTTQVNTRFNIGNDAHYVTNYSDAIMSNIINDLKLNKLNPTERLQLLNELIILAQSRIVSNSKIVDLVQNYKDEDREPVWDIIGLAIGELKKFVDQDDKFESQLKQLCRSLAKKQYDRLGWHKKTDELDEDSKLRAHAIGLTLYSDDEQAISIAKEMYQNNSINNLNPEIRVLILSTVVKHDQNSIASYKLFDLYKKSDSAELKQDICAALTSTKNLEIASELLETIKDTKTIRTQDSLMWVIHFVRNKHTREMTWQWVRDNWEWIDKTFGGDKGYSEYPRYIASALSTQKQLDEYLDFFKPMIEKPALCRNINMGTKEITERVDTINADSDAVRQALNDIQV